MVVTSTPMCLNLGKRDNHFLCYKYEGNAVVKCHSSCVAYELEIETFSLQKLMFPNKFWGSGLVSYGDRIFIQRKIENPSLWNSRGSTRNLKPMQIIKISR